MEQQQASGSPNDALTAWLSTFTIEPFALSVSVTQHVLGDKALSTLYEAGARGDLEFVKDGAKTLITLASIKRYIAAMPRAVLTPTPPRPERQRCLKDLKAKAKAKRKTAQSKQTPKQKPRLPTGVSLDLRAGNASKDWYDECL